MVRAARYAECTRLSRSRAKKPARGLVQFGIFRTKENWSFAALPWQSGTQMIAIGIDPGTRNLGWGLVSCEGNRLRHVAHGVIRANVDTSLSSRLLEIETNLLGVLQQYRPTLASVEGMFFDKNAQSAAKLGHARGVVLLCLERSCIPMREHSPARVKQTLTGNGRAEKSQVAQMVRAILNLESLPPSDAADALAIAITELRLDPRAQLLAEQKAKKLRSGIPAHLAEAIRRTKAARSV